MMNISFLNPAFLLLILAIPALWFFPRRAPNVVQAILRSLLFACVVLALARPILLAADGTLFQVLVLDHSSSITESQREQADALAHRWLQSIADKDKEKSAVVLIERRQTGETDRAAADVLSSAGTVIHIQSAESGSSSSLSAALAAAQRQIPEGSPGVVTLISDGLSTDQRWGVHIQNFIQRGIAVNTADLGKDRNDIYPAGLNTEPVIRAGQTAHIDVPVIGAAQSLQVRLLDENGRQLAISKPMSSIKRVRVPLEFEPKVEGFLKVRAEVIAQGATDTDDSNNTFERTLAVQSPIHLLYLGERMQHGARRLGELLGAGFEIKDGSDMDLSMPPDLKNYDLVMVDDRMAELVPERLQNELSHAVRSQGLGLVFSGGRSSFGTGGYDQSTLAKILPVEFSQQTEKRDPSVALALILDTSGSMGGMKIELARQVARLAVRRLKAHDRVGIVEFYGNKHWALPMQSAANKVSIDRAIARMQADGGTVLSPAIEEAYYGLQNVAAKYKHILIITDAGVEDANFEMIVRRAVKRRMNVSTVQIGAQAENRLLIDMAGWGKGRFYSASDRYALPEVILKQPSTMKLPAYKTGSFMVNSRGGEGWWDRIDRSSVPALSGYVETKVRPGAEVIMEVDENAHPVLASWRFGVGRVTALMTEPVGEGTQSWQSWRDYGRMLARVINRTADDSRVFSYTVQRIDDRVKVTAMRLSEASTLSPQAAVLDAEGQEVRSVVFERVTPDYFMAELTVDPAHELRMNAVVKDLERGVHAQTTTRLVSSAAEDVAAEKQVDVAMALDMAGLADATAGIIIDPKQPQAAVFEPEGVMNRNSLTLFKLWPYALLIALLLYLGELVYRRWPRA